MANLTIAIDDDVLKRARLRALEHDSSVNAVVREYLEAYAGPGDRFRRVADELLAASRTSSGESHGKAWTREELHEGRGAKGRARRKR